MASCMSFAAFPLPPPGILLSPRTWEHKGPDSRRQPLTMRSKSRRRDTTLFSAEAAQGEAPSVAVLRGCPQEGALNRPWWLPP